MMILNLGCGEDTYGTDFVDKYPSRKEVKKCDIDVDNLPFEARVFDKIYSRNLLEHLTNPGNFFKECYRVLKPGGLLVFQTDNATYWKNNLRRSAHLGSYEKYGRHGEEDTHFELFTEKHLENYLRRFNFKSLKIKYISTAKVKNKKNIIRLFINQMLRLTPFWRAGYPHLKAIGKR